MSNRRKILPWWNMQDNEREYQKFIHCANDPRKWERWWKSKFVGDVCTVFITEWDMERNAPVEFSNGDVPAKAFRFRFKPFPRSEDEREEFEAFADFVYAFMTGNFFQLPDSEDGKVYKHSKLFKDRNLRYI